MRVTIVFHSVCGNTYLMAKGISESFANKGVDVGIYRVQDTDLEELSFKFPVVKEYLKEILEIPIISLDQILESDYIFMGSPTYYGNVSAEMKTFMDTFSPLWAEAKLYGKRLVAFASCGNPEGGGDLCLRAINIFAQHQGMISLPMPANLVQGMSIPAYGLLHYSGDMGDKRPGREFKKAVDNLVDLICVKTEENLL